MRPLLPAFLVLVFGLTGATPASASALEIVVMDGAAQVPGMRGEELARTIAAAVQHVAPRDLSIGVSAPGHVLPPNRIEWRFHANPYAGGAVRYIGPARPVAERMFGMHRHVTAEAKLFLDGQFQSSGFDQATLPGAGDAAAFAHLVESLSAQLLRAAHS